MSDIAVANLGIGNHGVEFSWAATAQHVEWFGGTILDYYTTIKHIVVNTWLAAEGEVITPGPPCTLTHSSYSRLLLNVLSACQQSSYRHSWFCSCYETAK
jgi:hypothetical protein